MKKNLLIVATALNGVGFAYFGPLHMYGASFTCLVIGCLAFIMFLKESRKNG